VSAAFVFSFRSTLSRRSLSFSLFKLALQTQPDLFSTTTTNYYAQSQSPTRRPSPRHAHPIQTQRHAQGAKLVFESQWTADPFDVSVFLSSRYGESMKHSKNALDDTQYELKQRDRRILFAPTDHCDGVPA
jgi:hypothetical protein